MVTDYHNHILPGMDDGARDVRMSRAMLVELERQGFERICATPHFYRHRESILDFIDRRTAALNNLLANNPAMEILPGAEVSLERGLSEDDGLPNLTIGYSNVLLLELPYSPFKDWMTEEIYNITYRFGVIPLIAHVDRYYAWYRSRDMAQILDIEEAVFQVNYECLIERRLQKFVLSLVERDLPVVFGTDAHNIDYRPPNSYNFKKYLQKRLTPEQRQTLQELNDSLL